MESKKFFMIVVSLALILAGAIGFIGFIKGLGTSNSLSACSLNETISSCNTGNSITGAVAGTLKEGGVITGVVALFVLILGVIILVSSMRSKE